MENSIMLKMFVGFLVLLLVIRILGKKEISQITPIDLIYLLVLGGLLEESIYDDKVVFWQVIYSVLLWGALIYVFDFFNRKYDKIRPILKGKPAVLIKKGKLDIEELKKNKLEPEEFRSLLRQQGIFTLAEVYYAVLEPNGEISVMQTTSSSPITPDMLKTNDQEKDSFAYMLIEEGEINEEIIAGVLHIDEQWVRTKLADEGYSSFDHIFYAEWSEENNLYVVEYEEK